MLRNLSKLNELIIIFSSCTQRVVTFTENCLEDTNEMLCCCSVVKWIYTEKGKMTGELRQILLFNDSIALFQIYRNVLQHVFI